MALPQFLPSSYALGARLITGGIYTGFGFAKITDIDQTIRSVRAYRILPEALVPAFGTVLPVAEIALGVLLLTGLLIRPVATAAALLSGVFIAGIGSAWARGLHIECGCFGNGGYSRNPVPGYLRELAINAVIIAACGWLIRHPASPFSLDAALRLSPDPLGRPHSSKELWS